MGNYPTSSERPRAGSDRIKGAFITPYREQPMPGQIDKTDSREHSTSPAFLAAVCVSAVIVGSYFTIQNKNNLQTKLTAVNTETISQPVIKSSSTITKTVQIPVPATITIIDGNNRQQLQLPVNISRPGNKTVLIEFEQMLNLGESDLLLTFDAKPQSISIILKDSSFTSNARTPLAFGSESLATPQLVLTRDSLSSMFNLDIHRITEMRLSFAPTQPVVIKNVCRSYQETGG